MLNLVLNHPKWQKDAFWRSHVTLIIRRNSLLISPNDLSCVSIKKNSSTLISVNPNTAAFPSGRFSSLVVILGLFSGNYIGKLNNLLALFMNIQWIPTSDILLLNISFWNIDCSTKINKFKVLGKYFSLVERSSGIYRSETLSDWCRTFLGISKFRRAKQICISTGNSLNNCFNRNISFEHG